MPRPRATVVHDYFVQDGGAEAVALELARLLPEARVKTSFFDAARFGDRLDPARVSTWPLQRVPGAMTRFRALLPLYPAWFALLRAEGELVVSSSSAWAKAVRRRPDALHVAYVHSPLRAAWMLDSYLAGSSFGRPAHVAALAMGPVLRSWDVATAARPDVLVANSEAVRGRIATWWGRSATVIHPPVETSWIALSERDDGYYIVATRLLAYKRVDLAIAACRQFGRRLVVVGDGPERARLESLAGPEVHFVGHVDRARLADLLQRCHAYLSPGVEDFGIAVVEAMAAGKPVVAFRAGGAVETVEEGVTGRFFDRPDAGALAEAIEALEATSFDPAYIRAHAERFDSAVFRRRWRELLADLGVDPSLLSPEPRLDAAILGRR